MEIDNDMNIELATCSQSDHYSIFQAPHDGSK